jgi:protein involved in polysaccharide export with SLBB domain
MHFLWVFILVLSGCSHPQAVSQLSAQESVYRLSANDVVRVKIFDEPELTGNYPVDGQGAIALPLAGKVSVGGKSEAEAAQAIETALKKGGYLRNPRAALELKNARPVFVIGEVERAGETEFRHGLTVTQAVAMTGGYTYRADRGDITISRANKKLSAAEETQVLPGDVIEVGERFF